MKFQSFTVAIVATISTAAVASTSTTSVESGRRLQIGVEAGMLVNQLNGPEDLKVGNRAGLAAGVVVDFPMSETFAVRVEGIYQRRSSTLAAAGGAELVANSDSVQVPLMLRWSPIKAVVSPFLMAGPTVTFNVNNSIEGGTAQNAAALGYNPKTFEFGAAIGGGVDIGPAFAAARYNLGLTELGNNNAEFKSRGFQLLAGVRF